MADSTRDTVGAGAIKPFPTVTWSSLSGSDDEEFNRHSLMRSPWLMSLFIFFYSVIFLLGIVGNVLVMMVVARSKAMQTITNIFITNLAVADVCMCLLCVTFTPAAYFIDTWVFGKALCHILPMTMCVTVYVSTITSSVIAVDRYLVIVYPFKSRMKVSICMMTIAATWLLSISASLPLAFNVQVVKIRNFTTFTCLESWPKPQARQVFSVTTLALQYVLPCTVITFCYGAVWQTLRKRSKVQIGSGTRSRESEAREMARKKKTNKMLIAMVLIFVGCWVPLSVIQVLAEFDMNFIFSDYLTLVFFLAHVLAMSSTIYNPWLYAWMSDNFRNEFQTILPCLFKGCGQENRNARHIGVEDPPRCPCPPPPFSHHVSVMVNSPPMKSGKNNPTAARQR